MISIKIRHRKMQKILKFSKFFCAIHLPSHTQWWWWLIKFTLQRLQSFLLEFYSKSYCNIMIPGSSTNNLTYIKKVIILRTMLYIAKEIKFY